MNKRMLLKPDGRKLFLYSHSEITNLLEAPIPQGIPSERNPHFRWHSLRGEWVSYAGFRQERTFLPPPEFNPLAPSGDPQNPTELPAGDYEVAVFENGFPSMTGAKGVCEVVVYTQ